MFIAMPTCLRFDLHVVRRAASRADCTAGSSMPMRREMIAITTRSSMSVMPVRMGGDGRAAAGGERDGAGCM